MKTTTEPQASPEAQAPQGQSASGQGYRPDQGRLARMAAYWTVVLLVLFGCSFLHAVLVGNFESTRDAIGGISIPIVGQDLTPAFVVSAIVFAIGMIVTYRWQQRPKMADLLIDTESELRKVTWPGPQEVINSSMVVVVCVVLIGFYLAFADWFLARVMRYLLFGEV